jgi:1,4-dihydroxy-6-naphthoate synthase
MRELRIGCTPDPDDAFAFYALHTGKVRPPAGWRVELRYRPICELNRLASEGALDVAAISSVFYPQIFRRWAVLRAGASVGRGYGPRLAAREPLSVEALSGRRVGVPGRTSTGTALLRLYVPEAIAVPMAFEEIGRAAAAGEVDAGVLIHEELLGFEAEHRLVQLLCLGEEWRRRTELPLPVGLNVVQRSLGAAFGSEICAAVRRSILYALEHREEAAAWALRFSRARSAATALRFIDMFANRDTVSLPPDCVSALERLFETLRQAGLAPAAPALDLVEPSAAVPAASEDSGAARSAQEVA